MLPTVRCPQKVIGAYLDKTRYVLWARKARRQLLASGSQIYFLLFFNLVQWLHEIIACPKKGGNFNSPARGRRAPWRTARTWPSRRRSSRWPRGRAVKREKGKTLAAVCNKNHKQDYFFVIVPLGVRTYRRSKGEYIFACSNKKNNSDHYTGGHVRKKQEQTLFKRSAAGFDVVFLVWQCLGTLRKFWRLLGFFLKKLLKSNFRQKECSGWKKIINWKERAPPNCVERIRSNLNFEVILKVNIAKNTKLLKIWNWFLPIFGHHIGHKVPNFCIVSSNLIL